MTAPERPRRLCTVVHGPFPLGEPRVARQVKVALDLGYDVDVVAMRQPGEAPCEEVGGARVLRLPIAHKRGRGAAGVLLEYAGFTALATLRVGALAFRRRYSAIQVNNPPDFLIAAAIAPKALGARVIFDVHDLSPDMFSMRFDGRPGAALADRALRAMERWAARLADVVITVHEPYRQELGRRGVPKGKIAVVMNALDEALLPAATAPTEAGDGFRVVYHGTVTPHYGVQLLVEAASLLKGEIADLRVEVYGDGDAVPAIRARAAELGVADDVGVSGRYLPQEDVLERIRSARVGVIPNLPIGLNRYALSSKLFEYVALGVPVVSADLPTICAHFSDREVSFFRAGDAHSLADALLKIFRDPEGAATRARAALDRYEQYRWPANARRYAAVLAGA